MLLFVDIRVNANLYGISMHVTRLVSEINLNLDWVDQRPKGLNNRWNRWSVNRSIDDNRCQSIDWYRSKSINNRCSGFCDCRFHHQFLLIINANRSVGEGIQSSNIKCALHCKMCIRTCWNVWDTKIFWRQSMTIDEFRQLLCDYRLLIDWPMLIDAK